VLLFSTNLFLAQDFPTEEFLAKQRFVESSDSQDAVSSCGAIGVAQFLPSTWSWIIEIGLIKANSDISNREHQIEAQRAYMTYLYSRTWIIKKDALEASISAYNCGRGRVLKLMRIHGVLWKQYLPKETKNYLKKLGYGK